MSLFILVLFSSFCCLLDSFHQLRSERGAQSEKKTICLVHVVQSFSFTTAKLGICCLFANFNNLIPELEVFLHWVHLISFYELSLLLQMWQQDSPWDLTKIKFNSKSDKVNKNLETMWENRIMATILINNCLRTPSTFWGLLYHIHLFSKVVKLKCFQKSSINKKIQQNGTLYKQGAVPERPITANLGLKFCSNFVFYLPMYCVE